MPDGAHSTTTKARRAKAAKPPLFDACYLISSTGGYDTIHQATCILEHLTENMGERDGNQAFGEYLLFRTVADALRHGLKQILAEDDAERAAKHQAEQVRNAKEERRELRP